MLPAHAAQWLRQRPRPPGEEALYKYPTRRAGYRAATGRWCGNPHIEGVLALSALSPCPTPLERPAAHMPGLISTAPACASDREGYEFALCL